MYRKFLLLGVTVFLCGCVPPAEKYQKPVPPVPNAWPANATSQAASQQAPAASNLKWREFFADEKLQKVIEQALANNRDLRMATLNIERAQALFKIQRSQQYPNVDAIASAQAYHVPADMTSDNKSYIYDYNTLGLQTTSWEVDLFGRVRSLKSAALEQYFATEQARTATQISLVGAVATSYLALAADRDNLRLAQETFNTQEASYELILRTRNAGMASDLEVRQSRSQVDAARVDITRYTARVAQDENALDLLVGAPVATDLLPGELGSDRSLKDIAAGLPSEVLLSRPDILMAEHQLRAAYANIAAARANFFPRINLTGGGGLLSSALSELFSPRARTWLFSPQVALPIFDAGARKANLKIAQTDRDLAVAEYEKSIQSAFREVSDSLMLRAKLLEQENAQAALVKSLDDTYRLSEMRYKAGIDSYLSVLVAQRSLYGAQQVLISVRQARMSNLVALYKVLGGGGA